MSHFKLIAELERDIRNQVVIDQMKRLSLGTRIKILLLRYRLLLVSITAATLWTFAWVLSILFVNWP